MDNLQILDKDNNEAPTGPSDHKFLKILGIILRMIGFGILGPSLGLLTTGLLSGMSLTDLSLKLQSLTPENKNLFLEVQGWSQVFMFFVLPLLYIHFFNKSLSPVSQFKVQKFGSFTLLAILLLLVSFPIVAWLQELNKSIDLPAGMDKAELWMKEKEDQASKLTELLAYYNNSTEFWISLLVIAILPGIGEELFFRGLIQNEFNQVTRNPHFSIWVTGFLFSVVHLQFYGLIPRMMLGVLLGYLYYWSGSLTIPMIVHFLNNFLTLVLLNMYKQKTIQINPDSTENIPSYFIALSIIVFLFLLTTFRKYRIKPPGNIS